MIENEKQMRFWLLYTYVSNFFKLLYSDSLILYFLLCAQSVHTGRSTVIRYVQVNTPPIVEFMCCQ